MLRESPAIIRGELEDTMETSMISVDLLKRFELGAHDGTIGTCSDFLFEDLSWVIRYLVADTRKWLPGRKVLISPISIGTVDIVSRTVHIGLSKEQIKNSPPLDSDAPVSRKYEIFFNRYNDWSDYWGGSDLWGEDAYPRTLKSRKELLDIEQSVEHRSNLRSIKEVTGYRIHARDGGIGHIDDFLVDQDRWLIRYLVVDTRNWIPGSQRVIVNPNWVESVDWAERSVSIKMTKEQIESSPAYNRSKAIHRDYEKSIFDHYEFPYYW